MTPFGAMFGFVKSKTVRLSESSLIDQDRTEQISTAREYYNFINTVKLLTEITAGKTNRKVLQISPVSNCGPGKEGCVLKRYESECVPRDKNLNLGQAW